MRSPKFSLSTKSRDGWTIAVQLTQAYLSGNQKADQLLDKLPDDFTGNPRARCQSLFLGALRKGHRTQAALKDLVRKKAKPTIEAILLVSGYELIEADTERQPKIVHHAVEKSKALTNRFEQSFLNAVLRKLPKALDAITEEKDPAAFYSHPKWLVDRWRKEFPKDSSALLDWNQQIPETYLKVYDPEVSLPDGLEPTNWPKFFKLTSQLSWSDDVLPLLNQGSAYVKDPSTRLAPELLAPKSGERVLDLCAAPGGKAYDMAHLMNGNGTIVAVDLPGNRIARLKENLDSIRSEDLQTHVIESDLLDLKEETFKRDKLPTEFDAVMLDAPCSNTGVIQRRTDVKWRLRQNDIQACAQLQLKLLTASAQFVRPGGRIVYSTCSIETVENREVVDRFLKSEAGSEFTFEAKAISLPWQTRHDGAGAFLLQRKV